VIFTFRYFPEKEVVRVVEAGETWQLCSIEDKPVVDWGSQKMNEQEDLEIEDKVKDKAEIRDKEDNTDKDKEEIKDKDKAGRKSKENDMDKESRNNDKEESKMKENAMDRKKENKETLKRVGDKEGSKVGVTLERSKYSNLRSEGHHSIPLEADEKNDQKRKKEERETTSNRGSLSGGLDHSAPVERLATTPALRQSEGGEEIRGIIGDRVHETSTRKTDPKKGVISELFNPIENEPEKHSKNGKASDDTNATKVKESKYENEKVVQYERTTVKISKNDQNKAPTATSHPMLSDAPINDGKISSDLTTPESAEREKATERSAKVSRQGTTSRSSDLVNISDRSPGLVEASSTFQPVGGFSALAANSSPTTSNTPRLPPNVEATTASYSITALPSRNQNEEKGIDFQSTQSSVSKDLPKLPSAVDQSRGISSNDNRTIVLGNEHELLESRENLDKLEKPALEDVDQSENGVGSQNDSQVTRLNSTMKGPQSVSKRKNGKSEIEMSEDLLEDPLDSIDLKQVMKDVLEEEETGEEPSLQEEKEEKKKIREKRGARLVWTRFGGAQRGRTPRRPGAARHYMGSSSGRPQPENSACCSAWSVHICRPTHLGT